MFSETMMVTTKYVMGEEMFKYVAVNNMLKILQGMQVNEFKVEDKVFINFKS